MPFEQYANDSKIWIYYIDQPLSINVLSEIEQKLKAFCVNWTSHNQALKADALIFEQRFIVLLVDESQNASASGCSIDKSTHFLKEIASEYQLNLFDKMLIPYINDNQILHFKFNELNALLESKTIDENTVLYSTNINILRDFKTVFKMPLKQHWLGKGKF